MTSCFPDVSSSEMESETESETKSLASYSQTKSELHATPLPNHMASTPPHNNPTPIPVAQPITFVHRPALQMTHHRIPLSPITSLIRMAQVLQNNSLNAMMVKMN